MKKLMIVAAIVCAAAISHGAALQWGISEIDGNAQQKAIGNIAYFMDGSTYNAFLALAPDEIGAYCAEKGLYSAKTVAGRSPSVSSTNGSYTEDDLPVSGYTVLFDNSDATKAASYVATALVTKTEIPDAGNLVFTTSFKNIEGGWQSTAPVPEPTSGLLLLIGVAGLALKRRRA